MKISTRLAITISIITSVILVVFGITVLLFSSNHQKHEFQERLKERVVITEKILLEKESFQPDELKKMSNQFLQKLPQETEEVLALDKKDDEEFIFNYPTEAKTMMLRNNVYSFYDGEIQGESRVFTVKGKKYLIIVTAVDKAGLENLSYLKNIIILLVGIGIPLIFLSSFFMTRRALLPITKKINKANTISATTLDQRLNVHNPNDELGQMAIAFNNLLDRLQDSFEAQKAFIRNASHEIRNPLTTIMGEAEVTNAKERTAAEYGKSLDTILSEAETLNATVNNLLQLSKVSGNELGIKYETIDFGKLLHQIKGSYDFMNPDNQIEIELMEKEDFSILGNENLLKTALINLLDNACKFSSNQKVMVKLTKEKNWLTVSIKDLGIGIEPNDINHVLTPFYRGSNAIEVKGSGIGLSLTDKIIALHQGELKLESQVCQGTIARVLLPHTFS